MPLFSTRPTRQPHWIHDTCWSSRVNCSSQIDAQTTDTKRQLHCSFSQRYKKWLHRAMPIRLIRLQSIERHLSMIFLDNDWHPQVCTPDEWFVLSFQFRNPTTCWFPLQNESQKTVEKLCSLWLLRQWLSRHFHNTRLRKTSSHPLHLKIVCLFRGILCSQHFFWPDKR